MENRGGPDRPAVGVRGGPDRPAVENRGGPDRPAVGDRGGPDRPAVGDRGGPDRPAVGDRGGPDRSAVGDRGGRDRPAVENRGGQVRPAVENRGGQDRPAVENRGGQDRPAVGVVLPLSFHSPPSPDRPPPCLHRDNTLFSSLCVQWKNSVSKSVGQIRYKAWTEKRQTQRREGVGGWGWGWGLVSKGRETEVCGRGKGGRRGAWSRVTGLQTSMTMCVDIHGRM